MARADSGRRALEMLAVEEFDLVLLDLLMPDMNGFQVLERLKADERLHDIPVIMISGLQETDSVIRCIEAGAEDYLPKPFDPVLLRARINACLERKRWRERERVTWRGSSWKGAIRDPAAQHPARPDRPRLNDGEMVIADRFEEVTILFADLVGFTSGVARHAGSSGRPAQPALLGFDALCRQSGIEKIKTIGDAYMAAAGLPEPRPDHAEAMAEFALAMLDALERVNAQPKSVPDPHRHPHRAGGRRRHRRRRFLYDVWGDTVNLASRWNPHGLPGRIHVSTRPARAGGRYEFEARGLIDLKGMGKVRTAFLTGGKEASRRNSWNMSSWSGKTRPYGCLDPERTVVRTFRWTREARRNNSHARRRQARIRSTTTSNARRWVRC